MNRTFDIVRNVAHQVERASDGDSLQFDAQQVGAGLLAVAGKVPSSRHPLGFYHLELTDQIALTNARVRVHIWTRESLRERDDLGAHHAHTWSLASCVIVGSLRDTSFEARLADDGSFQGVEVDYAEGVIRPTSRRYELEVIRTVDVHPGTVYRLPPEAPHQTDVLQVPAATLVVARESGLRSTVVFSPVALEEMRSGERLPLSEDDTAHAIAATFGLDV